MDSHIPAMTIWLLLFGAGAIWTGGCSRETTPKGGSITGVTSNLPGRYVVAASQDSVDRPGQENPPIPITTTTVRTGPGVWEARITIGPLPVPYQAVSVPFVPFASHDRFAFEAASHQVGCARGWTTRSGGAGALADIPLQCQIEGTTEWSGVARAASPWVEVSGPSGRIRRTPLSGNWKELWVVRHTELSGLSPEISFQQEPLMDQPIIPAGTVLTLIERIESETP